MDNAHRMPKKNYDCTTDKRMCSNAFHFHLHLLEMTSCEDICMMQLRHATRFRFRNLCVTLEVASSKNRAKIKAEALLERNVHE